MNPVVSLTASLLGADPLRLAEAVRAAEKAAVDAIHVDVMDGHFVPKIAQGVEVVAALRAMTELPIDVHLQTERPEGRIPDFAAAGADHITFHVEATRHAHLCAQQIRKLGRRVGIALNPGTPLSFLEELVGDTDYIWMMTHNPATVGFILSMADKAKRAVDLAADRASGAVVAADGGVSPDTIGPLVEAGVRHFVAGSAIFGGAYGDVLTSVNALRDAADRALPACA